MSNNDEFMMINRISSAGSEPKKRSSATAESRNEPVAEHIRTQDDEYMAYFGKQQRFKRSFRILSIIGLTCTLMITWEGNFISFAGGFKNGGPAGLVGQYIFVWVGNLMQALVMSELGSMIPLAGGQYNWVAILAPPTSKKFLSYLTGWITFIAWQATTASTVLLAGNMMQGLAVLNHPNYEPLRWQATLMFYAVIALALFVNTYLVRLLPGLESTILVIHVVGFVGILIPLVYLAPKGTTADVFQTFLNEGHWPTNGLSFFIGAVQTMFAFIGIDGATHLAEEIENAAVVIPKSMIITVLLNGGLGFGMLIATLFCLGDIDAALNSPTGFPFMQIFLGATRSVGGATAMSCVLFVVLIFCVIGALATSSRMLWAFAREKGVPYSAYVSRVEPRSALPLWAIGVTVVINLLIALINIGSSTAFNALTGLSVAGFYSAFLLSAGVALKKRLTTSPKEMHYGPFKLGRFAVPIYLIAMAYSVVGLFFSFWPPDSSVTAESMNWSSVVFFGVLFVAMVHWWFQARHYYTGPIVETSGPWKNTENESVK